MDKFFTNAFNNLDEQGKESFYKTVFMNDDSEYAAKLRVEYYRAKFKSMGENVTIGKGVNIINPQYISVGDNVQISDGCTLIARGEQGITLSDGVRLQHRVYLDTERTVDGYIKIGKGVYIGTGTTLFGHMGLEIGDDCLLAQNITLTPYSHIFDDPNRIIYSQGGHCKKVTIGNDVYIGMGCCVMYSGDIGEGSVIGAHSTVVKPIPPYSIAVGTPAKVIKKRD
jgi:galactoside O-acetyltransferase